MWGCLRRSCIAWLPGSFATPLCRGVSDRWWTMDPCVKDEQHQVVMEIRTCSLGLLCRCLGLPGLRPSGQSLISAS